MSADDTTSSAVNSFTDEAVEVFRACARVPTATRAHISQNEGENLQVEVTWTQREVERGKKVSFDKSYFVQKSSEGVNKLCASTFQSDATNIVKVSYASECSRRAALVHDRTDKDESNTEPQQFIEVWNGDGLEKTIIVTDLKDHGKINEDIHFGSFHISSNGNHLLYIAERKKPKATSFFAKPTPTPEDSPPIRGAEYDYEPNWGEQLSSVVNPVPVIMDLETEKVTVIDLSKMDDISAGQAVWVPGEDDGIVFIGWDNSPRKLGFIYCLCRKSAVYYANTKTGKCTKLTDSTHDVFSPRFNPQGSSLVYFQSVACSCHHSCASLMMIDWASKSISTVVDKVSRPESSDDFPGFYTVFLPKRCWDQAGTRLIFHNMWGSVMEVTCVDTTSGSVTNVSGPNKGAWVVLDVFNDVVVAQFASLNTCPQLYVGAFPAKSADAIIWTELSSTTSPLTKGLSWKRLYLKSGDKPSDLPYEALLLLPPTSLSTPPPLVVTPHGGPHVATPADFLPWQICFAALGYAVLMVNYRGSMGFGQDSIFSLPGNVGTHDVEDVQNAVISVVKQGLVDEKRVCVVGGSHGGFLVAHLIGQYPDFYKAGALRNPVIDISTMYATSDIPDWCYVESGITFDPTTTPNPEELKILHSKSPITYVDKVQAPVLLHIGACDLRCPPSQGLLYYNTLKAQGKEVRLLLYPKDSHPISTVHSDADAFVNTAIWFYRSTMMKS